MFNYRYVVVETNMDRIMSFIKLFRTQSRAIKYVKSLNLFMQIYAIEVLDLRTGDRISIQREKNVALFVLENFENARNNKALNANCVPLGKVFSFEDSCKIIDTLCKKRKNGTRKSPTQGRK